MNTLKAEKRNPDIKAKKLRRDGYATGVLFGSELKDSIPLQFAAQDALRFIKEHKEGTQVILEIGTEKTSAIVKNIEYNPMKREIIALDCQALVSGEKISTTVPVKLLNEDAVQGYVGQELTEIHYKAEPAHLLDAIEIDLEKLGKDVTSFYVRDLKLGEKNVDVVTPEDTMIFHVVDHTKDAEGDTAAEGEEASAPAAVK